MPTEVIAVIMAGGQGERLSILSEKRAKPAVPFAGKYRMIDFVLSNCVNSAIFDVLVLTQYRPHSLHNHIGIGRPWDLDRNTGGIQLLQPYVGRRESDWYRGTADAVYQNLNFILDTPSEHVLVLAGDHIYRMDYRPMIARHVQAQADVTVGVITVPIETASRFGILASDEEGHVTSFEEKPKQPKGAQASMGIYIFRASVLAEVLRKNFRAMSKKEPLAGPDFGHNIIPQMLHQGSRVMTFPFTGYWQDVGTVQAYWEAHMDLLSDKPAFDLYDPKWIIHTRSEERPPLRILKAAMIHDSLLSHGCIIKGTVERSVLSPGVIVEEGATVRESILLFDCVIGAGSQIDRCILDKEVIVGKNSTIGYGDNMRPNLLEPDRLNSGITLIGKRSRLPDNIRIGRNCKVGTDLRPSDFQIDHLDSGETIEDGTFEHSWERRG